MGKRKFGKICDQNSKSTLNSIENLCKCLCSYSMEAHLVHFNAKYGNFETALTKKDGLVVVAFFIQAFGDIECNFFRKITDFIPKIQQTASKCAIDPGIKI